MNEQKYNLLKKILLLSDTHSYIDERIISYAKEVDEIWHAGDIGNIDIIKQLESIKPVRAVYGNIDDQEIRTIYPLNNRFTIEGIDVWITHIGGYPGKYNPKIKTEIMNNPPNVFICGHSHILKVMPDKKLGLIHLNPGAIGKHGFQQVRTMLRFQVSLGKIQKLEVIEFTK